MTALLWVLISFGIGVIIDFIENKNTPHHEVLIGSGGILIGRIVENKNNTYSLTMSATLTNETLICKSGRYDTLVSTKEEIIKLVKDAIND